MDQYSAWQEQPSKRQDIARLLKFDFDNDPKLPPKSTNNMVASIPANGAASRAGRRVKCYADASEESFFKRIHKVFKQTHAT